MPAPAEGVEGAAAPRRRRRGGRRERGERRPDTTTEGLTGAEGAADEGVEADLPVVAAANEAAVSVAADTVAPVADAPVAEIATAEAQASLPLDTPAAITPVETEAVATPVQNEPQAQPTPAADSVVQAAETVADTVTASASAVIEAAVEPAVVEPAVVAAEEAAPTVPQTDSSESTLVRAMESLGGFAPAAPAPAPVAAPDLKSSLSNSGLVMVETSATASVAPVEVEQTPLGRRRRPAAVVSNEPMQQVETRGE